MGKLICSRGYYCFAFCQDVLIKTDLSQFRRMTGPAQSAQRAQTLSRLTHIYCAVSSLREVEVTSAGNRGGSVRSDGQCFVLVVRIRLLPSPNQPVSHSAHIGPPLSRIRQLWRETVTGLCLVSRW